MYLDSGPFSGAVQITHDALTGVDLTDLAPDDRRFVGGVRTLARELRASGYAMHQARQADDRAHSDWPQLLVFVRRGFVTWSEQVYHDGAQRCRECIIGPCEELLDRSAAATDRDDAYAVLRHSPRSSPARIVSSRGGYCKEQSGRRTSRVPARRQDASRSTSSQIGSGCPGQDADDCAAVDGRVNARMSMPLARTIKP